MHLTLAFFLLFDELLTYMLASFIGRGAGLGVIICFALTFIKFRKKINLFSFYSIFLIALQLKFDSSISQFYIMIIYILYVVTCSYKSYEIERTSIYSKCIFLILIASLISKLNFDIFSLLTGAILNRPTGLYSEPSHLAYYVTIAYYLSNSLGHSNNINTKIAAIFTLMLNFSLTALLPLFYIIFSFNSSSQSDVTMKHSKKIFILLLLLLSIGVFISLQIDYILERIGLSDGDQSLSLSVLIYYWQMALNIMNNNLFIGFGFDQFFQGYSYYSSINGTFPDDLNSTDGSFLFVKILTESGLVFTITFLWNIIKILKRRSIFITCIFLQFVFFRGYSLTSAVVLLMIYCTLLTPKLK